MILLNNRKLLVDKNTLANRIYLIDYIRGLAILLMVIDHFTYDYYGLMPSLFNDFPKSGFATNLYDFLTNYSSSTFRLITRNIVLLTFMSLTGICCSLSISNKARGIRLFIVAEIISAITFVLADILHYKDLFISFGVLHCISITLLIIGLLFDKIKSKWFYLIIGTVLLTIGLFFKYYINEGTLPLVRYSQGNYFVLLFKGIVGLIEFGSDCFAITLYGGEIFIGVFIGKLLYKERKPHLIKKYHNGIISFMGRNSLLIYLASQVIIPFILVIILLICGYRFAI